MPKEGGARLFLTMQAPEQAMRRGEPFLGQVTGGKLEMASRLLHRSLPQTEPHLGPLLCSPRCSGDSVHSKQSFLPAFPSKQEREGLSIKQLPESCHSALGPSSPSVCPASFSLTALPGDIHPRHRGCRLCKPPVRQEQRAHRLMRTVCFYGVPLFQGSPSSFQTIQCYCSKWGN